MGGHNSSISMQSQGQNQFNYENEEQNLSKIDEFALLTRIVKLERINFLREIHFKQLFVITQKDMFTGDSVLHYAIFDNKTNFVKSIIDLYENEVNMRNEDGNTPLQYACMRGNLDIVKLLHAKGALVAQKNAAGLSPLLLAIYYSHYFIVHYLLAIETVYDSVNTAQELHKCLQFGISGLSSQIFYLLVEVFDSKIEEMFSKHGTTIWDMKFNNNTENFVLQQLPGGPTEMSHDQSNSLLTGHNLNHNAGGGGYTLLHQACSCGNFEIFEYILDHMHNLNIVLFDTDNPTKETPLHWAVLKNNYRIVQQLIIEYQAVVADQVKHQQQQDMLSSNQSLIPPSTYKNMLDIDNVNQQTPLFVAVIKGFLDIAELLVSNGLSSIEVKDMGGDTPLHWAVMLGNLKTVEFLIEKGANIEAQNYNKNTPLMIACTNSHVQILELLLTQNADINKDNQIGMTPLHAACLSGSHKAVGLLLDQQADFLRKDKRNFMPLHYAIIKDNTKLIRYLQTDRHFSILQKKYHYEAAQTLMSLAVLNGSYQTIKLLAEWGDNLDSRDNEGNTYLHLAAMSGHVNIFLFFLSKQISIQSKNTKGKTAIELAKIYKHDHLIKYLREHFEDSTMFRNIVQNK